MKLIDLANEIRGWDSFSPWTTNRFFWRNWSIPNHQKSLRKNSPLPKSWPEIFVFVQPLKVQQQDSLFSNIFFGVVKKVVQVFQSLPTTTYEPNDLEWQVSENPILSHVTKGWMKPPFTKTYLEKMTFDNMYYVYIIYINIYELDIIHPFCYLFSLFPLLHGGSVFGNGFSHLRNYKLGVKHGTQEKSTFKKKH